MIESISGMSNDQPRQYHKGKSWKIIANKHHRNRRTEKRGLRAVVVRKEMLPWEEEHRAIYRAEWEINVKQV